MNNSTTTFDGQSCRARLVALKEQLTLVNLIFAGLLFYYCYLFWQSIAPYWFHPDWTTDDALQQSFPYWKALYPDLFRDDLITEVMTGYLTPIHYWLNFGLTWLTGSPIMAGHLVMLIQLLVSLAAIFGLLYRAVGFAPAAFGVVWMLHTRHIVQRLTGGLPRGWSLPVLCVYLFFLMRGAHRGVLITLLVGCLLHPPATMLAAVSYGLLLSVQFLWPSSRAAAKKPLITLICLAPIYAVITYAVIHRPEYVGQMVTFEEASQMPAFQRPKGRFPFVPLKEPGFEIRSFAFQAFSTRWYDASRWVKMNIWWIASTFTLLIAVIGTLRRRKVLVPPLLAYLVSVFLLYFAARALAFKLYVPDRHLQFPMAVFFVIFTTIEVWRALGLGQEAEICSGKLKNCWLSVLGLVALSGIIWMGSGLGLKGAANFNYSMDKHGGIFRWMRKATPQDALIAGNPTLLDGVQLLGMRQGYATTETAHPFYPKYYREIERRLELVFRAYYAPTLKDLYEILAPEGIDYFVFKRSDFYPEALQNAYYHPPADELLKQLASRPWEQYAYREAQKVNAPLIVYKDDISAVLDLKALAEYLQTRDLVGSSARSTNDANTLSN